MKNILHKILLVALFWGVVGCESLDYKGSPQYILYIQDSPADYESLTLSVASTEIYNGSEWIDLECPNSSSFDLLSLTGGVMLKVGEAFLAAGNYSQLRLTFDETIRLGYDGTTYTPSASSLEILLPLDVTLSEDVQWVDIIDIQAAQSITSQQMDDTTYVFEFSPVAQLVDLSVMGVLNFSIVNTSSSAIGDLAYISAVNSSTQELYSTYLNEETLLGVLKLPEGEYTITVETPSDCLYAGTTFENVQILAGEATDLGVIQLEEIEEEEEEE
ncbi:MAG: DUF4382 domain-containing protein [Rikenellaceae bacterium]